jgi:para-nitrobenzyl esterase
VLFFLHGGGNTRGSTRSPVLDGAYLSARQAVVVVTANYRLGLLGFLALPELDKETPQGVSGNYGMLDQIAALEWVQRNISSFGGDPTRVLLFGESAGARDVCAHLASPLSKGLFSAAAMESGNCEQTRFLDKMETLAAAETKSQTLLGATPCAHAADRASCLRGLSIAAIVGNVQASLGDRWEPLATVDGYFLPDSPTSLFARGMQASHVPFLIGDNADEMGLRGLAPDVADARAFDAEVQSIFGKTNSPAIEGQYPLSAFASPTRALVALWSDAQFICPARRYARAVSGTQGRPVYRYFFTHALPFDPLGVGAVHSIELHYVFHNFDGLTTSSADRQLADEMGGYWARFAATGNPNPAGSSPWPRYDGTQDTYLRLDVPRGPDAGVHTAQCNFWDAQPL